jgi:hypothetical protein
MVAPNGQQIQHHGAASLARDEIGSRRVPSVKTPGFCVLSVSLWSQHVDHIEG